MSVFSTKYLSWNTDMDAFAAAHVVFEHGRIKTIILVEQALHKIPCAHNGEKRHFLAVDVQPKIAVAHGFGFPLFWFVGEAHGRECLAALFKRLGTRFRRIFYKSPGAMARFWCSSVDKFFCIHDNILIVQATTG